MSSHFRLLSFVPVCFILTIVLSCQSTEKDALIGYPDTVLLLDPAEAALIAKDIRKTVAAEVADGLQLNLWASDGLMADPIAISVDPYGDIYYTQGNRIENSEFDIRGHRDWMTESISWQSVEERRAFLRRTFTDDSEQAMKHIEDLNNDGVHNWKDLTVQKEEVWRISDESGDGVADKARLYIQDFHEEISDLANGVEYADGNVFVAVGPDLWKTIDTNGDGIADEKTSLVHGFAVHIGFGAHGMSGVTKGPDGRIWWGIGDIGMNVVDQTGKRWKYPNQGVIVRCEPDGSNFEVFSAGHRNTHEFVFDKYGNLITEDNDGDHRGERERLVYIINGSDSGWRINWQFGKYTDPDNNSYKVWMDEKLHIPYWEGQAAYILPPIQNYVNGPTGMVYNPGTALSERWKDHFFIAEFRGSPANSPIHAFTLKQDGAGFALNTTMEVVKGVLPTGLDFGPDGALYFGDWIDGWGAKHEGRMWKLDVVAEEINQSKRAETKSLLQADFESNDISDLTALLGHEDMRIRLKAQFELANRGQDGYNALQAVANENNNQLSRIHGMWGMGQQARKQTSKAADFVSFLNDADEEIVAQACKLIGDVRYTGANDQIIALVNHTSPRVRLLATEALGRIGDKNAVDAIIQMIRENNGKDMWLRHAGMIALGRMGDAERMTSLANDSSVSVRLAAVVALRRMQDEGVSVFLNDQNELVVTEAARAINDDWSIEGALDDLGSILNTTPFANEALIRRSINANLRVGQPDNMDHLFAYAMNLNNPNDMRAEAIAALSTWSRPSLHDRVDGRYRGEIKRPKAEIIKGFETVASKLLNDNHNKVVISAAKASGKLGIKSAQNILVAHLSGHSEKEVRSESLRALMSLDSDNKENALSIALADKSDVVRSTALELLPESDIPEPTAVMLFKNILKNGTIHEKQTTYEALGSLKGSEAINTLGEAMAALKSGNLDDKVALDVLEAIMTQGDPNLITKVEQYYAARTKGDHLAEYRESLNGGNVSNGREIFYNHEAAQCTRCHSIWEWGGDAGPNLTGVGTRLTPEKILESLIEPSAEIVKDFAMSSFRMKDESIIAGTVIEENDNTVKVRIPSGEEVVLNKNEINEKEDIPSSMPSVKTILSKKEIRDVVAFLSGL